MSDPAAEAIARARAQGPFIPDPTGETGASHPDSDAGVPAVRVPPGRRISRAQQNDTYLPHIASDAPLKDLTAIRTAHLDEEQKQALLDQLLVDHNTHTARTRDIEIERDKIDLENKRRFSSLGYKFMAGAGIIIALVVVALVGMLGYALIMDKPMIDGGIFGAVLNTFVEMMKILVSIF